MSCTIIHHWAPEHYPAIEGMHKQSPRIVKLAPTGLGIFNTDGVINGAIIPDFDESCPSVAGCSSATSTPAPSLVNQGELPVQEFATIYIPDLDIPDVSLTWYPARPPTPTPTLRHSFALESWRKLIQFLFSWWNLSAHQPPAMLPTPLIDTVTRRDAIKTRSMVAFLRRLLSLIKKPQSKIPPPRLKTLILAQQYASTSTPAAANQQGLFQRLLALLGKLWVKHA
ncbi:hypothetical protein BD779DRAFT_1666209 [Infundibulicybe gibba]|nr:hypothetical protein BD779DRAFT_1666209 [Infundibulicybe gibba]